MHVRARPGRTVDRSEGDHVKLLKRDDAGGDDWPGVTGQDVSAFRASLIVNGQRPKPGAFAPRYVYYQYCVSIVILTFKRGSGLKVIQPGKSAVLAGLPYTLVSLVFGWWGIPWGPIYTIQSIYRNLRGGIDVTDEINESMAASEAAASAAEASAEASAPAG